MERTRRIACAVPLAAIAVAGCTGSGEGSSAGASPPALSARSAQVLDAFVFEDLEGDPLRWEADREGIAGDRAAGRAAFFVHVFQPDCGKCEELARALERFMQSARSVSAAGIAHRLERPEAQAFVRRTGASYPVAVGSGSDWARRWSRGDPLYIVGPEGRIVYQQTGFREDDVARWRAVAEDLAAGRPIRFSEAAREVLQAGDLLPRIELPDLITGRTLTLATSPEGLVLTDAEGRSHRYRASVGFFSRYWSFSVEEMVHLQTMHERFAEQGLLVYAISMHPDPDTARRMTLEMGITYPVLDGGGSALGESYAYGWPAFITDAVGVIRYTQRGFESGDEERYDEWVRRQL